MDWLSNVTSLLTAVLPELTKKSRSTNIHKRLIIRELRNNLMVFRVAAKSHLSSDEIVLRLENNAIKNALNDNFNFNKLKRGKIPAKIIYNDRNNKYMNWDCELLVDKIDEKIEELKLMLEINKSLENLDKGNVSLMLSNLFYRMKLLADFIRLK